MMSICINLLSLLIDYSIYFLVCVDDIIVTSNDLATQDFITTLSHCFSIKDLGSLHYLVSVEVLTHQHDLFLLQHQYILDLLTKTQMIGDNPDATLQATSPTLTLNVGSTSLVLQNIALW